MLSYRHAFHAGNFADVLKHVTLVYILDYLVIKPGPVCYIDTHAGAGGYDLSSTAARKNREYETGIARLWDARPLPEPLARYLGLVREYNAGGPLQAYPGSPWFARRILRDSDQLFLYEMHNNEAGLLNTNTGRDRRVSIRKEDGFSSCKSLLPPRQRRGMVLLDPSYEIKTDYGRVVAAVQDGWERFRTGVYVIWYPVVDRKRIDIMERSLSTSGINNILLLELGVSGDAGAGMTASGVIVINPPWKLQENMADSLLFLATLLGGKEQGRYRLATLAG